MSTVNDVFSYLCTLAPTELQMDFDNSGFLVGHGDAGISRVLVTLDITSEVVKEAEKLGAELIVSHHPVIFHPIRALTDKEAESSVVLALAEKRIAAICMHTNLDIAEGGVNDALLSVFGLRAESVFDECGRTAELESAMPLCEFVSLCRDKLGCKGVRYYNAGRSVKKLAVLGGAGGGSAETVKALGCDTFLTADVKHSQFITASEIGLNLIDADHFCTEWPIVPVIAQKLAEAFPEAEVITSSVNRQLPDFA